jgi:predicted CoA-binding protein
MSENFNNPDLSQIKAILRQVKTIAVVGLSPKENRPSHKVARHMQSFGYQIVPVRPAVDEVLGEKAFADLGDVTLKIDLVDVFRAPDKISPIIDSCIEKKIVYLWLQDGVVNHSEALRAQAAGITVIMDRCIYRDYKELMK